MKKLLLILAFIPVLLFSQTRKQRKALAAQKKADQQVINNFKSHTQSLTNKNSSPVAPDNAWLREYISDQFKAIGLQPKGTRGYLQPFTIDNGKQINAATFLKVNGATLAVKKDYFPLTYSAQKAVTGMPAMSLREKGVPWFTDVKEWQEDNLKSQSFDINKIVQKEAERAALKGATALFLYNSSNIDDNLRFNKKDKTPPLPIPIIYITSEGYKKNFNDQSQILDIELNVAFEETVKNAINVAGYIDNGAASNIIIAAPYDHFYKNENEDIGADKKTTDTVDIVSGTSMLIELARMLIASKAKNNNYTFIAYSGENLMSKDNKLFSSSVIISTTNYIINLNRVGRYDEDKNLLIAGYGTSANWLEMFKPIADKTLELNFDSIIKDRDSSTLYARVPVLNFYTGPQQEYTTELALVNKINYEGELQITRFIYRLIEATDTKGKLAFEENSETQFSSLKKAQQAASSEKTSP